MRITQGETVENIALYAFDSERNATIEITGAPGITVEKTGFRPAGTDQIFLLKITAAADAPLGNRSLLLTNSDGSKGPAVFGLLEVITPDSNSVRVERTLLESEPLPARINRIQDLRGR